jgi:hypothetical protein
MEIDYKKLARNVRNYSGMELTPAEAELNLKLGIEKIKDTLDKQGVRYPNESQKAFLDWLRNYLANAK